jgi:superfamily II DNA or RNA helicase
MSALEKKPKLEPVNPERMKPDLTNLDPAESTKLDLEETSKQFPYASYRPGQRAALEAARDAFKRGKKYVVIEAPTGAGKSGIAVTLAREAKNAYILTPITRVWLWTRTLGPRRAWRARSTRRVAIART